MSDEHEQTISMLRMIDDSIGTLTEAVRALKPEQSQLLGGVGCTIGVGDGSGQLFVHGSYEACQRVRSFVDEVERLRAENEAALEYDKSMRRQLSELRAENNSLKGSLQAHEAMFSSIREACDLAELAEQDDGYLFRYVERVTAELKRYREREEHFEAALHRPEPITG